jgi:hypothetical protein
MKNYVKVRKISYFKVQPIFACSEGGRAKEDKFIRIIAAKVDAIFVVSY